MAEVTNFTDPLSGYEVIEDVLGQVRQALKRDCSLRREDGYSGGYKGTIKIELDCFAVRTAHIEITAQIIQPPEAKTFLGEAAPEDVETDRIEETIEVPVELNLKAVRERIEDSKTEVVPETPTEEAPNLVQSHAKRKYTRRNVPELAGVGATTEEPNF